MKKSKLKKNTLPALPKSANATQNPSELDKALGALKTSGGVVAALRSTKQGIADLLLNTDESLSIKLAVVFAAALIVQEDDDEWDELCAADEWVEHPKLKPKRTDPLRATLRLAVGFEGRKADSTVHRYYKALGPLFVEKVSPVDIPRIIRESGGIEKMRQASGPKIDVTGTLAVMTSLQAMAKTTKAKIWVEIDPVDNGITKIRINKFKAQKAG